MSHNRIVECACHSPEHMIVFSWWPGEAQMYVHFHLNPHPFWQRLWNAIRYILGHRSDYGHFDEIVLDGAGVEELRNIINGYIKSMPKVQP